MAENNIVQILSPSQDTRGDYTLVPPSEYHVAGVGDVRQVSEGDEENADVIRSGLCGCLEALLHKTWFQSFEALLIVGNAIVIGMETDMPQYKHWNDIENGFLAVFTAELLFKIIVIGPTRYFDYLGIDFVWNIFDFLIVGLGVFDAMQCLLHPESGGGGGFATIFRMIRLLRILRIFRIVKFLKELYVLAFGLVEAAKAVFWVTVLMFFVLYVCSIVLVKTIGSIDDDDRNYKFLHFRFGHIVDSMLTLFVLMSSPNFVIYQDTKELTDQHPIFTCFLIMFITFGSFGMIALLTGVISESMFQKNEVRKEQKRIEQEDMKIIIITKCEAMFGELKMNSSLEVKVEMIKALAPRLCAVLAGTGIQFSVMDMSRIIEFMDVDGTGMVGIDEFVHSMLKVADGLSPMSIQELQNRVGVVDRKVEKLQASWDADNGKVDKLQTSLDAGLAAMNQKISVLGSQNEAIQRQIEELARIMRSNSGKGR